LTATRTKVAQPFLQELLEFGTGAAFQKHVPVTPRNLGFYFLLNNGDTVVIQKDALLATLSRLPVAGNFSVGSEHNLEGLAAGRPVNTLFSRRKFNAYFAL
jgi:hypothetical protein